MNSRTTTPGRKAEPVLDWLRRDPHKERVIDLGGKELPVVIRRLDRARRLTMRLASDGSEVRISIPGWPRPAEARASPPPAGPKKPTLDFRPLIPTSFAAFALKKKKHTDENSSTKAHINKQ